MLLALSLALAASGLTAQGCLRTVASDSPDAARPKEYVHAPPLVWWTRERGGREVRNFLGFLYHQSRDSDNRRRATHFLWPLGMSSAERCPDGVTKRVVRVLPLWWITRRSEPSGAGYDYYQVRVNMLGPVFSLSADNYGEGYVNAHILWPLGQYFRGEKRVGGELREFHSFRLLPFVHLERSWRPGEIPRGDDRLPGTTRRAEAKQEVRLDERGVFRFLHFMLGLEREAKEGVSRLYLLGASATDRETRKKSIVALWGTERGPSTDREHQLLWRFFVFRRSGAPTAGHDRLQRTDGPAVGATTLSARAGAGGSARSPGTPFGGQAAFGGRPSDRWRLVQWMFHGSPRVSGNLGPVLSYESDWETDTKRVSVLAGLYSYERVGLRKSGRLLWFIPWRGKERKKLLSE